MFAGLKETTEALVKKRQERGGNAASEMTPWEQYLEKKKDKKKQKKDQKKNKGSAEVRCCYYVPVKTFNFEHISTR